MSTQAPVVISVVVISVVWHHWQALEEGNAGFLIGDRSTCKGMARGTPFTAIACRCRVAANTPGQR